MKAIISILSDLPWYMQIILWPELVIAICLPVSEIVREISPSFARPFTIPVIHDHILLSIIALGVVITVTIFFFLLLLMPSTDERFA